MAGTIVVDRLESDASYASRINIASPIVISNTATISGNLGLGTAMSAAAADIHINDTMSSNTAYHTAMILQAQAATGPTGNSTVGGVQLEFRGRTDGAMANATLATIGAFVHTNAVNNQGGIRFRSQQTADTLGDLVAFTNSNDGSARIHLRGSSMSASGTGIAFPSSQASSSDPNTLDDYEEGTWTPTITSSGASGFTFLDQFGWYVKIGRQVSIFFRVNVNSLSSASGSSTVFVSNLPFTSSSGNGIQGGLVLIDATRWGSNFPTAGYIVGASTNITLTRAIGTTVAGSDPTLIQASDLRTGSAFNGNTVQGSMTYLVPT